MLIIRESEEHYFYVMAWRSVGKKTGPAKNEEFDLYDDAAKCFEKFCKSFGYVQLCEYIGEKRKLIMEYPESEDKPASRKEHNSRNSDYYYGNKQK